MYKYIFFIFLSSASFIGMNASAMEEDDVFVLNEENVRGLARDAKANLKEFQDVVKKLEPQTKASIYQRVGKTLMDEGSFKEAYELMHKVNIEYLDPQDQDDFAFNLASLYIEMPDKIPGKKPQEALQAAWNLTKHHKTSFTSFFDNLRKDQAKKLGKKPDDLEPKNWVPQMMKGSHEDILNVADPLWNSLYLSLFATLGRSKNAEYIHVFNSILKDIFNGDPNKEFYTPFYILGNFFRGHPEFMRLQRATGMISIIDSDSMTIKDMLDKAQTRLKDERTNFKNHMAKRVEKFAIQEMKTLENEDLKIKAAMSENKGKENFAPFAKDLIARYSDRLFPNADGDMNEWLAGIKKSDLERILIEKILPKVQSAKAEETALRIKGIVYNRLAIMVRDKAAVIKEITSKIPKFDYEDDTHLKELARGIVDKFEMTLFEPLPKNDFLNAKMKEYSRSKRNEVTWRCLRVIFITLDEV